MPLRSYSLFYDPKGGLVNVLAAALLFEDFGGDFAIDVENTKTAPSILRTFLLK
jgi:hypothetical protein